MGDETAKAFVLEPLYRNHQDLELAIAGLLHHPAALFRCLAGVQSGGGDPLAAQKGELIVHQGQQGRDDQGQVGQCEGGQLITEGFPRASREDGCGALAGQQTTDHRFLPGPQAIKAEVSGQ